MARWRREFRALDESLRPGELEAALGRLTDKQLEALDLVHVEGLTQVEAARRLGITGAAMSGRLKAAGEALAFALLEVIGSRGKVESAAARD